LLFDFSFLHLHTMSNQVESAVLVEGVDNSNLTYLKKVTIQNEESYEEGKSTNGGKYSFEKELYYFEGTHPTKGVFGYWKVSFETNSSEFTTDSNGVFCDYVTYRNFGNVHPFSVPPLFKEQCEESESGQETPADIWNYLTPVTEEEFFFSKDCVIYQEEGKRMISWGFDKCDRYHE
jgi:hypothetical protein